MEVATDIPLNGEDTKELARILECELEDLAENLSTYCSAGYGVRFHVSRSKSIPKRFGYQRISPLPANNQCL